MICGGVLAVLGAAREKERNKRPAKASLVCSRSRSLVSTCNKCVSCDLLATEMERNNKLEFARVEILPIGSSLEEKICTVNTLALLMPRAKAIASAVASVCGGSFHNNEPVVVLLLFVVR